MIVRTELTKSNKAVPKYLQEPGITQYSNKKRDQAQTCQLNTARLYCPETHPSFSTNSSYLRLPYNSTMPAPTPIATTT